MRRIQAITRILLLTLTVVCASSVAVADPPGPVYIVIVNPNNPTTSVSRKFLEDAFLKKTTRWPNDDLIKAADQPPNTLVRSRFSTEVVHRSVSEVKSYWQQRIFSGQDVPPPELDDDDEVVKYVLKHKGGVGYVTRDAKLSGVKILVVK